MQARGR